MKTKKKKLTLTKDTIANLNEVQLKKVHGGECLTEKASCWMETDFSYYDCPTIWISCDCQ
jgi:hypothetical protein